MRAAIDCWAAAAGDGAHDELDLTHKIAVAMAFHGNNARKSPALPRVCSPPSHKLASQLPSCTGSIRLHPEDASDLLIEKFFPYPGPRNPSRLALGALPASSVTAMTILRVRQFIGTSQVLISTGSNSGSGSIVNAGGTARGANSAVVNGSSG